MGAAAQRGKMRPQQPQQRPMGGQPQQRLAGKQPGMGPGLPMPPQVADRTFQPQPYQPIGVNNPPFNPNPVQPTPGNMPAQGKGAGTPSNIPGYAQPYVNDLFSQQAQVQQRAPGQVPAQGFGQQLSNGTYANQMPIDTSRQAYDNMMAQSQFTPGGAPSYEQFVQQRTAPQMPQSLPQKPGLDLANLGLSNMLYGGGGQQPTTTATPYQTNSPMIPKFGTPEGMAYQASQDFLKNNPNAYAPQALPPQVQQPAPVQPGMNQMNLGSPMGGGKGPV
jgi:hypothetical protein